MTDTQVQSLYILSNLEYNTYTKYLKKNAFLKVGISVNSVLLSEQTPNNLSFCLEIKLKKYYSNTFHMAHL